MPIAASHPICAVRLGGFVGSLWRVCDRIAAATEARPQLRFSCVVAGEPPAPQLNVLIRLVTFLVADAAGACDAETTGRIRIAVERKPHGVVLSVEHDGWAPRRAADGDRSLAWARHLAEASGGTMSRQLEWDRTVTCVTLPSPGATRPDAGAQVIHRQRAAAGRAGD